MEFEKITNLYKYSSFNDRSIYSLMTGKIWFPKPDSLNDPYDCAIVNMSKFYIDDLKKSRLNIVSVLERMRPTTSSRSEFEKNLYSMINDHISKISEKDVATQRELSETYEIFQSAINNFGILSLSETPENILMWSHYASGHTGICFQFERNETNKLGLNSKKVIYSNKRIDTGTSSINTTDFDLFCVKHKGWKYEREWRLVEDKGNQHYEFPGRLNSVICGCLMSHKNIELLTKLVESYNSTAKDKISIKYAKMNEKTFKISIRSRQR